MNILKDCPLSVEEQELLFETIDDKLTIEFPYKRRELRIWKNSLQHLNKKEADMKNKPNLMDAEKFVKETMETFKLEGGKLSIPKVKNFKGGLEEEAVLLLSDIHLGYVNKILNMETGKTEVTYNPEIAVIELNKLLDGVFTINKLLRGSYRIKKLNIFGLGDLVTGDMIFKGQRFFVSSGVGKQVIDMANLLADFFRALLKEFEEIEFTNIIGNHGRMSQGREAAPTHNNFDYLVGKFAEAILKDEKRVKFDCPDSRFTMKKIYGWKYYLHHGNEVRSWMGLPYYGVVRQAKSRRAEVKYDIECIGHFHVRMEIPVGSKSYTLVNGSFVERDENVWATMGTMSKAEQTYFGVSKKRPRTWSFSIDLHK